MKKTVFLMLPVAALLYSGCAPFTGYRLDAVGSRYALIDARIPASLNDDGDRGIHLPITPRSSVNIDVECILDYVQGDSPLDAEFDANEWLNPWIRLDFSY